MNEPIPVADDLGDTQPDPPAPGGYMARLDRAAALTTLTDLQTWLLIHGAPPAVAFARQLRAVADLWAEDRALIADLQNRLGQAQAKTRNQAAALTDANRQIREAQAREGRRAIRGKGGTA